MSAFLYNNFYQTEWGISIEQPGIVAYAIRKVVSYTMEEVSKGLAEIPRSLF